MASDDLKHEYAKAERYIFNKFKRELPEGLFYHGPRHTLGDVVPATEKLARLENLGEKDIVLAKTAALYHDIGYVVRHDNNEEESIKIARKSLPELGYNKRHIDAVSDIILATRLPQTPASNIEKIVCDADLDYLGRMDFFYLSDCMKREEEYSKEKRVDLIEWYKSVLEFIKDHNYHTESARKLRDQGKQDNIRRVKMLVNGRRASSF